MTSTTPFFRVRWTLRATARWSIHSYQHAILYAVLCDAARGDCADGPFHMPEGLLLDAPETARDSFDPGDEFAFGATLLAGDSAHATRLLHRLTGGLQRLGYTAPKKPVALGGNYELVRVEDLVAHRVVQGADSLQCLPHDHLTRECEQLFPRLGRPITLRFLSPLRLELPEAEVQDGYRHAGSRRFLAGQFLRTVQKRLAAIGIGRSDLSDDGLFPDSVIELASNRLVWLDLEYGRQNNRKALGGSLGRVQFMVRDMAALAALVWGQYARVGRNLSFGFGRYRIEDCGPDPAACGRAVPLLDMCLTAERVTSAAADHDLEPTTFATAATDLRAGMYRPSAPHRVRLANGDGTARELQIPTRQDRALQRLLLGRLGPACDRLFETSSFAWRKGLSRESAARRIQRLVADGWVFAVRADFDAYFERIPQDRLQDRLEAWLGDDAAVRAILEFVQAGQPDGVGVPTGAPLSPLLGNLFLDEFDEEIERAGGRLVRYADDFLVLCRTREAADQLHRAASDFAALLLLQLNDDVAVLDLREPFDFLGFRFEMMDRWHHFGPTSPHHVQELGSTVHSLRFWGRAFSKRPARPQYPPIE